MNNKWMKIAAIFAVLVLALSVTAAGCTGNGDTDDDGNGNGETDQTDSDNDGVPDAEDQFPGYDDSKFSDGTLVLGQKQEPSRLHPVAYTDVYSGYVLDQVYDPLIRTNPNGVPNADGRAIAESFSQSEDGKTVVIQLQEGIKFHDGEELTAEDVVFSISSQLNTSLSPPRKANFESIDTIEATGEYEVTIQLSEVDVAFVQLALPQVFVVPKHYVQENGWEYLVNNPMGSGPYEFVEYETGSHIKLTRNEDYWRHPAYVKNLEMAFYPESSSAVMALQQGQVHYLEQVPPDQWRQLKQVDSVTTKSYAQFVWQAVSFNHKAEPFNNKKVRQAFAYAVNMSKVVEGVRGADLVQEQRSPVQPSSPAYNEDLPQYEYDVEKAKQLLEEAGYSDGISATFYVPSGDTRPKEVEIMAKSAEAAGFDFEIRSMEWGSYEDAVKSGEADVFYSGWLGSVAPKEMLNPWHSKAGWNWYIGYYDNPEFDEAFEAANTEPNPEERNELYKEAQTIMVEDMASMVTFVEKTRMAHHNSVIIPEDAWNPYMDPPLIRAYEWQLSE